MDIEKLISEIREGSFYQTLIPWVVGIIGAALVLGFAVAIFQSANGQSVSGTAFGELEAWARPDHCYQNTTEFGARGTVKWGPVSFSATFSRKIWGSCDAKSAGSFLNLESDKVNGKTRELLLLYHWGDFAVGGRIYRNGVQHIWRTENQRYDGFPPSNSWETALKQCFEGTSPPGKDGVCAEFGYYDRAGIVFVYSPDWARFQTSYLFHQWKENTLPPTNFFFSAEVYPLERWTILAGAQNDVTGQWACDLELRYQVAGPLTAGLAGGVLGEPGWGAPGWDGTIERVAVTISIRPSELQLYGRD